MFVVAAVAREGMCKRAKTADHYAGAAALTRVNRGDGGAYRAGQSAPKGFGARGPTETQGRNTEGRVFRELEAHGHKRSSGCSRTLGSDPLSSDAPCSGLELAGIAVLVGYALLLTGLVLARLALRILLRATPRSSESLCAFSPG